MEEFLLKQGIKQTTVDVLHREGFHEMNDLDLLCNSEFGIKKLELPLHETLLLSKVIEEQVHRRSRMSSRRSLGSVSSDESEKEMRSLRTDTLSSSASSAFRTLKYRRMSPHRRAELRQHQHHDQTQGQETASLINQSPMAPEQQTGEDAGITINLGSLSQMGLTPEELERRRRELLLAVPLSLTEPPVDESIKSSGTIKENYSDELRQFTWSDEDISNSLQVSPTGKVHNPQSKFMTLPPNFGKVGESDGEGQATPLRQRRRQDYASLRNLDSPRSFRSMYSGATTDPSQVTEIIQEIRPRVPSASNKPMPAVIIDFDRVDCMFAKEGCLYVTPRSERRGSNSSTRGGGLASLFQMFREPQADRPRSPGAASCISTTSSVIREAAPRAFREQRMSRSKNSNSPRPVHIVREYATSSQLNNQQRNNLIEPTS